MPTSSRLLFVSSNSHKYSETKEIMGSFGIQTDFYKLNLNEIQSDSLSDIAANKAQDAFAQCQRPLIIEDAGLFVDALAGFPGPYSSYIFKTIGNDGILSLVNDNRKARFVSIVTFCAESVLKSFVGKLDGAISESKRGDGWGYDPIFIPKNLKKTFAELDNKNTVSHRYKALEKFANWYVSTPRYNGQ